MIKKLRGKFILINMLLVSVVLLVVFAVLYWSTANSWDDSIGKELSRLSQQDSRQQEKPWIGAQPGMGDVPNKSMMPHSFQRLSSFYVVADEKASIVDRNTDSVTISEETLQRVVDAALEQKADTGVLQIDSADLKLQYLKSEVDDGWKIVCVDLASKEASLRALLWRSIAIGALALVMFFFISLFFSNWVLHPVEKAWSQQRQFIADASHELKTPLTVILANTGILLAHPEKTIDEQRQWLEGTQEESVRMKQLIDEMLFLAKSDALHEPVLQTEVNFSDTLFGALLPFESIAYENGLTLRSECIEPNLYMQGDASQLGRLIGILTDNACKYAGKGGVVTVSLEREGEAFYLHVNNTGDPIPPEDIPHLFERFYRGDRARVHTQDSFGLGLAIADSIVHAHHGKLSVQSSAEEGTTFTVRFPLIRENAAHMRSQPR